MTLMIKILLVVAVCVEAVFLAIGDNGDLRLYRGIHLLEMVSLIAIVTVVGQGMRGQWLLMIALASAFLGDVINSGLIDLTAIYSPQVLLSLPFFLITHLLYLALFWQLLGGSLALRLLPALISVAVVLQLLAPDVGLVGMIGLAAYGTMLFSMAYMSLSFLRKETFAPWVALGAWVFVASDCMIGGTLFSGLERTLEVNVLIWISYLFGQAGIASALALDSNDDDSQVSA